MLKGNERIKDVASDDICNYFGNLLSGIGATSVEIKKENHSQTGEYRVLYIKYKDGICTRIAFNCNRASNSTIEDVKQLVLLSRKHTTRGQ